MEHLTGINIRSAVEKLNLSIKEIFKIDTSPKGDCRLKHLETEGNKKTFELYPDLEDLIDSQNHMEFSDAKTSHTINKTLTASVFDYYLAYKDISKNNKIFCTKSVRIEFVNTEILSFEEFCINLMAAQAFSGSYGKQLFIHSFIGIGEFSLEDYARIHPIAVFTHCNMLYFFVYHKNILSSIDNFILASYGDDIKSQRHFLSDKEYYALKRLLRKDQKLIDELMDKLASQEEDFDDSDDLDD